MQRIEPLPGTAASCIGVPVQVRAALLPICLPASASQEAEDDSSATWVPATNMGDLDKVPGSWLWPSPALPVASI